MADWKELLKKVLLADGAIDEAETRIIRKEIMADGVIEDDEVDFLVELRNKARKVSPSYTRFFFAALQQNVLADGVIDVTEAKKLRKILFADGVIDSDEKKFLKQLKKKASKTSPEFDALLAQCLKS